VREPDSECGFTCTRLPRQRFKRKGPQRRARGRAIVEINGILAGRQVSRQRQGDHLPGDPREAALAESTVTACSFGPRSSSVKALWGTISQ